MQTLFILYGFSMDNMYIVPLYNVSSTNEE